MEAKYKTLLQQQKAKKAPARVINDPGVRRNLGWSPSKPAQAKPYIDSEGKQVMPTPLLNLAVAKTLLEQDRSPEAAEQVFDLVSKVVKQQEKATSQRLESDPALCRSSQYKPPRDGYPQDVGSRTGSSEQRRRDARNRKDAIPISSDHGERAQPRRPSPPLRSPRRQEDYKTHHRTDMPPPKQCGIVIRDNAAHTRHDEEHHQGHKSMSHHDPPRLTSNRDRRGASQEGNSKKANPPPPPPPSPPSSHHGGRGPRGSCSPSPVENKKKNLEPYDARSRIDKIHEAREGPYLGPRCFGPAIRSTTYPKGFWIDKTIKPYDGTAKPATWL